MASVTPIQHPVAAARQHLSLEPGAGERSAFRVQDAPRAQRCVRDDQGSLQLGA